jgi:hypothetical protein
MIAWSKSVGRDGVVTKFGASICGVSEGDVTELLNSSPPFLVPHEEGWSVVKWNEWQTTRSEQQAVFEVARANGARGAEVRKATLELRAHQVSTGQAEESHVREVWLTNSLAEWPAPGRGFHAETKGSTRGPFFEAVKTVQDWEDFQKALSARLRRYRHDPEHRDMKRKYLGSFKNFCTKWRDEMVVSEVEEPGIETPPADATEHLPVPNPGQIL